MITITKSPKGRFCTITGGLAGDVFSDLDDMLSCFKKGAQYSAQYKLGRWDGKIHMLQYRQYNGEYIFPAGAIKEVLALLKANNIDYNFIDEDDSLLPYKLDKIGFKWKTKKELYDYQKDIADRIMNNNGCGVCEMPTGAGKTLTALKIAQMIDLPFMVLVHRAELFDQWRTEIRDILGEEPVMIGDTVSSKKIRAEIKRHEKERVKEIAAMAKAEGIPFPKLNAYPYEADKIHIIETANEAVEAISNARCCIAMVQTLHSYMKDSKSKFGRLNIPMLIVDECHTCPADTVFDVIFRCTCKYTIGLSATVGRNDGLDKKITAIIGPRIKSVNVEELVDKNILATPKFYFLYPEPPEFYIGHIPYHSRPNYQTVYEDCIINGTNRNNLIAGAANLYLEKGDHQIYIHVTKIAHGEILNSMIPGSVCVFGSTKDRKEIIEKFRKGEIKCLISTLLKEGVSIPSIDVLIYAAGGASSISCIQTIGRALRKKSDGRDAIIIDVYDAVDAYLLGHTHDRIKTYEQFYGSLFLPKYISSVN